MNNNQLYTLLKQVAIVVVAPNGVYFETKVTPQPTEQDQITVNKHNDIMNHCCNLFALYSYVLM